MMDYASMYPRMKARLLGDEQISAQNRRLFERFLNYEEYKLKRINGLAELDANSLKTLLDYVSRLRAVDRWFDHKSWEELTRDDIKRVYDAVEEGTIRTLSGNRYEARSTYYRRIMRGKPFEMAGKKQLVQEVMEFQMPEPKEEVRFIREQTFRDILSYVREPIHRAFLWLAWDIGENSGALVQLKRSDFKRAVNPYSNEPEYHVSLRREILKRSRRPRTESTNYSETVELLDRILADTCEGDNVFTFGYRSAFNMLRRAVRKAGAHCIPNGQVVTLKDLRSSMACDLLSKGWTTDEVNQRLGHKPSSREIDKYVNWLALSRDQPKRRLHEGKITMLTQELQQAREREQLSRQRFETVQDQVAQLQAQLADNNRRMFEEVQRLAAEVRKQPRPTPSRARRPA